MMKKIMMMLVVTAILAGTVNAGLKVDFGRPDTPVQEGFQGFMAEHENALDLYTPREFAAFDTTVTVSLSWNPYLPDWQSMQMIDRGGNDGSDTPDLLRDWTGTDARKYGDPLTMTISGLPAGEYGWLSYHHDTEDQTGIFDVAIVDANGQRDIQGIDISDGREPDSVKTLADVTKLSTIIVSDGSDITFTFSTVFDDTASGSERFFVMNGFEIVPEPTTIALLGMGVLGMIRKRR